jgi:Restriction endonuclease AspBHI N-terminal/Restriction endonuclease
VNDRFLKVGESYRFGRGEAGDPNVQKIGNHQNWFFVTAGLMEMPTLWPQRGIYSPSRVDRQESSQIPLIICTTSPHRAGSDDAPWTDILRPDEGYAWYFGDNKTPGIDPASSQGNRKLLEAMKMHASSNQLERELAPPVLLLTTHGEHGFGKGYKRVEGLAVVKRAEQVVQRNPKNGDVYRNFRFEFEILDTRRDDDLISMEWLNSRLDPTGTIDGQSQFAPEVWKEFMAKGGLVLPHLRRDVLRDMTVSKDFQLPPYGTDLALILEGILQHFEDKKIKFEAIASRVIERIFEEQGLTYRTRTLTQHSGDGGYDFVGQLDLDPRGGFASSRQIVLGQAKCERSGTSGRDVARLVARLNRGWYGAYVTTSFFTKNTQHELFEDRLPVILVPGARVASIVKHEIELNQMKLPDYLDSVVGMVENEVGLSSNLGVLLTTW